MALTINQETPIKYHLNMHLMERYIDDDAILFELVKYNLLEAEGKKGGLDNNKVKFTSKTLKYIFGQKMDEEGFKEKVVSVIKSQIKQNLITPRNKSMYIEDELLYKFYKKD